MKNEANGTNLALGGGACMAISFIPGGSSQDSEPPRHHTAPRGKLQGDKTRKRGRQLAPARSLCHGRDLERRQERRRQRSQASYGAMQQQWRRPSCLLASYLSLFLSAPIFTRAKAKQLNNGQHGGIGCWLARLIWH